MAPRLPKDWTDAEACLNLGQMHNSTDALPHKFGHSGTINFIRTHLAYIANAKKCVISNNNSQF